MNSDPDCYLNSDLYNDPDSYLNSDPDSQVTDGDYCCDNDWEERVEERDDGTSRCAHVSETPARSVPESY